MLLSNSISPGSSLLYSITNLTVSETDIEYFFCETSSYKLPNNYWFLFSS